MIVHDQGNPSAYPIGLPKKTLIYDIESCLALAWLFRVGYDINVSSDMLLGGYFDFTHILSISYMWWGENKVHTLDWGNSIEDEKNMIEEFDKLILQADLIIGKNNKRFDDKHVNTNRLLLGNDPAPAWFYKSDDLEKQFRRLFNMQAYNLHYLSKMAGLGGKDTMSLQDWKDIAMYREVQLCPSLTDEITMFRYGLSIDEIFLKGLKANKKMSKYGRKDVRDTKGLIQWGGQHLQWKYNNALHQSGKDGVTCTNCSSANLTKNGVRRMANNPSQQYQRFACSDCGWAGTKAAIGKNGQYGAISKG